jgi:hypothetical protein
MDNSIKFMDEKITIIAECGDGDFIPLRVYANKAKKQVTSVFANTPVVVSRYVATMLLMAKHRVHIIKDDSPKSMEWFNRAINEQAV